LAGQAAISDEAWMARLLRLTTERSATIIVFLLLFAMAARVSADPDMWWHLRLGEYILETGNPVYADIFSHTHAGQLHRNHSWLAQLVMFGLWRLAGHLGLTLYVSALAASGMFFLYRVGRGSVYMQGFVLVIGGACAAAFWSPRPQMFTFLFSALLVFNLFELKYRRRDHLWHLPPLFAIWGNCHGGWIIGFLFLGAFVLGEWINQAAALGGSRIPAAKQRKLLLMALLSLALLPINPLGLEVFAVPFNTIGIGGLQHYIQEWQSPDFSQPYTWGFIMLLLLAVAALVGSGRRPDATEYFLLGGMLLMALLSGRNLPLFAIASAPIITIHINDLFSRRGWALPYRERETPRRLLINVSLIGLVALGVLLRVQYVSSEKTVNAAVAMNWPVHAVERLNSLALEGKLFNSYNWGGYLLHAAPGYPVFIDGRTDLYAGFLDEYAAAYGTSAWHEVFDKWVIDIALVESDGSLAIALEAAQNWRLDYADEVASIFLRNQA